MVGGLWSQSWGTVLYFPHILESAYFICQVEYEQECSFCLRYYSFPFTNQIHGINYDMLTSKELSLPELTAIGRAEYYLGHWMLFLSAFTDNLWSLSWGSGHSFCALTCIQLNGVGAGLLLFWNYKFLLKHKWSTRCYGVGFRLQPVLVKNWLSGMPISAGQPLVSSWL